jgi:hypothetical protein
MANQEIVAAIEAIQKAFVLAANGRQHTVAAALVLRSRGLTPDRTFLNQFTSARVSLLNSATALDQQLEAIRKADPNKWLEIIGAFNTAATKIPGVNISSPSVEEVIDLAVPPIPDVLFSVRESAETQRAAATELARYETAPGTGLNGLGALQTLVGAVTGKACLAAAAGAGLVTAGVGAVVVGAGCLLLSLAVIAGTTYAVISLVKSLPTSANTALAAADALVTASEQISKVCRDNNLTPEQCTELQKAGIDNTKPPPMGFDIPWTWLAVGVGGLALWHFWPTITAKVLAARSRQLAPVAGLRRSRRR